MADLSLAQGLISAATPRDVTAGIRQEQEQAGQRAFQTGAAVGGKIGKEVAKYTDEFAADPERFELMQQLILQNPQVNLTRFAPAYSRFKEFLKIRDQGKTVKAVSPDYKKYQQEAETISRNQAKLNRMGTRLMERREKVLAKYGDVDGKIAQVNEDMLAAQSAGEAAGVVGAPENESFIRKSRRELSRLTKLKKARDEEVKKFDELVAGKEKEIEGIMEKTPRAPRQFVETTEDSSRADVRRARREINRTLPSKSALRELIQLSGGGAGGAGGQGSIDDFFKAEAALEKVRARTTKSIKDFRDAFEKTDASVKPAKKAWNTMALGAIDAIAVVDPNNLQGSVVSAGPVLRHFLQNTANMVNQPELLQEKVSQGLANAKQVLANNVSTLGTQAKEAAERGDGAAATAATMAAIPELLKAASLVNDKSFRQVSDILAPYILGEASGRHPAIMGNYAMHQNASTFVQEAMKKGKHKGAKKEIKALARKIQEAAGTLNIDWKGDILKMDIDKIVSTMYSTLTEGQLAEFAPFTKDGRGGYDEAIVAKSGPVWEWLKTMTMLTGGASRADMQNNDIMAKRITDNFRWEVIDNKEYLKGWTRYKRRYLNKIEEQARTTGTSPRDVGNFDRFRYMGTSLTGAVVDKAVEVGKGVAGTIF